MVLIGVYLEMTVIGRWAMTYRMSYDKRVTPELAKKARRFVTVYVMAITLAVLMMFAVEPGVGTR